MLAVVEKTDHGAVAKFDRPLNHKVNEVWAALTENDKLEKWFHNLEVVRLGKNGIIKFKMNDGTGSSFDIKITEFEENAVLEYEWGDGKVRFELTPSSNGCLLVLNDIFTTVTDHTPKDIAGWHVCLDVLSALLDGQYIDFPKSDWEKWYNQYVEMVNQIK